MAGKLDEQALIQLGQAYDAALVEQKPDKIDGLCSDKVVLHADGISLNHNIEGLAAVKQYQANYNKHYNYKHLPLALAASERDQVVFSLSEDKDVSPKLDAFSSEDKEKMAVTETTTSVAEVWRFLVGPDKKITDIWFNRQLARDEIGRKMKTTPNLALQDFDIASYADSKTNEAPDADMRQKMHDAAVTFNKIWATGDADLADQIMVEDVRVHALTFGDTSMGRSAFKKTINGLFQNWKVERNYGQVAVSRKSAKAFVYWEAEGTMENLNEKEKMSGMNVLVFNGDGKIAQVLGFRQLLEYERKQMLRDERL